MYRSKYRKSKRNEKKLRDWETLKRMGQINSGNDNTLKPIFILQQNAVQRAR
jgi:hypothetical protein